ncbi:MAG: hypothetical protein FWG70_02975 [Oscillospiraceae bacterium]|nr:hypothetical protein [Oscillospiraceae bacterium]
MVHRTRETAGWVKIACRFTLPSSIGKNEFSPTGGLQSADRAEIPYYRCWIIITIL